MANQVAYRLRGCVMTLGAGSPGLFEAEIPCEHPARYEVIVYLSEHPDDALQIKVCGHHHRWWRQQVSTMTLTAIKEAS